MPTIDVIDSHTGGEPTRLVIAGGPDLGPGSMAQRLASFRQTLAHRPDLTRPADPHAND